MTVLSCMYDADLDAINESAAAERRRGRLVPNIPTRFTGGFGTVVVGYAHVGCGVKVPRGTLVLMITR